jgi:hypothetical protein
MNMIFRIHLIWIQLITWCSFLHSQDQPCRNWLEAARWKLWRISNLTLCFIMIGTCDLYHTGNYPVNINCPKFKAEYISCMCPVCRNVYVLVVIRKLLFVLWKDCRNYKLVFIWKIRNPACVILNDLCGAWKLFIERTSVPCCVV